MRKKTIVAIAGGIVLATGLVSFVSREYNNRQILKFVEQVPTGYKRLSRDLEISIRSSKKDYWVGEDRVLIYYVMKNLGDKTIEEERLLDLSGRYSRVIVNGKIVWEINPFAMGGLIAGYGTRTYKPYETFEQGVHHRRPFTRPGKYNILWDVAGKKSNMVTIYVWPAFLKELKICPNPEK